MNDVETYLESLPTEQRKELKRLRLLIIGTVPKATEGMGYGMPVFKYKGKYLIGMAGFKNHLSLFPGAGAIEALGAELGEHAKAKGTIQFTLEDKLPDSLVKKVVLWRKADIDKQDK